jgi:Ammonia permease
LNGLNKGKPTVVGIATGMVAGLATITPAAGTVGPEGALLIWFARWNCMLLLNPAN